MTELLRRELSSWHIWKCFLGNWRGCVYEQKTVEKERMKGCKNMKLSLKDDPFHIC